MGSRSIRNGSHHARDEGCSCSLPVTVATAADFRELLGFLAEVAGRSGGKSRVDHATGAHRSGPTGVGDN